MAKEPELGQMAFGNPTGSFEVPEWVDALIDSLLREIERVYWNHHQEEWDRFIDPGLKGVIYHSYYWGEDPNKQGEPNLAFSGASQEIRWYKYPGRGSSCSVLFEDSNQWVDWYNYALEKIRANEPPD